MNAHNITHVCLAKASGRHLSEAANEPRTFAQIDAECNAAARSIVRGVTPERLRQFEDARELMGVER